MYQACVFRGKPGLMWFWPTRGALGDLILSVIWLCTQFRRKSTYYTPFVPLPIFLMSACFPGKSERVKGTQILRIKLCRHKFAHIINHRYHSSQDRPGHDFDIGLPVGTTQSVQMKRRLRTCLDRPRACKEIRRGALDLSAVDSDPVTQLDGVIVVGRKSKEIICCS